MKNYDLKILKNQCGSDSLFFNEMIDLLIQTSGTEIVKMEEAFLKKDMEKLGYYAHKILSPYRQIQADYLCSLLQEIEGKAENNELNNERGSYLMQQVKSEAQELTDNLRSEYLQLPS